MKKLIAALTLLATLIPFAQAAETVGDKAHEVKKEAVQAKRTAGTEIRHGGRTVKATGRKARQAVITRCGDGRHTIRGASGCAGHGGVSDSR